MTSHRNFCNQNDSNNINPNTNNSNTKSLISDLRCPSCGNICLIILDKGNYNFSFKCNYCSNNNNNQNNDENIKNYYKLRNALIDNEYPKNSDFFCKKHFNYNLQSYCKSCNLNICERCLLSNLHKNHEKIELNSMIPEENEVFTGKINLRKNKEKYQKIINNIINTKNKIENEINLFITRITEFYKLEEIIIKNYKVNMLSKNYYFLQNFLTINKNLEVNFPLIDVFISNSNFEARSKALIEIINKLRNNRDIKNDNNNKNNNNNNNNNNNDNNHDNDDDNDDDNNNHKKNNYNNNNNIYNNNENKKNNYNNNNNIYNNNDNKNNNYNNNNNGIYLNSSSSINRNNNKLQIQNMKKGLRNERIIKDDDNIEYKTEKIYISLENTFQKNEKLKDNALIQKEFFNLVKIVDDGKNNANKDNNERASVFNQDSNNYYNNNNYSRDKFSDNENNINNDNLKNNQEYKENFNVKKEKEIKLDNIIRSIEFLDKKKVLICDSTYLKIYEIDDLYNLNQVYSTKEIKEGEDYNINYATVLKNGNIIICTTYKIYIIKLKKINSNIINHTLIQELSTKSDNINKVIEIPNKSSIISCDENYITKFKKSNNIEYKQVNMIKTESECKCIEYINDDVFAAIMPDSYLIGFYDIDSIHNNYYIVHNINTIHGRYVISNADKLNRIFFAGTVGVYVFSNINYKLIAIYHLDHWISALSYNFEKDCLICGGVSKIDKKEINNKGIDLIIIDLKKNELEENENKKKQFRILEKKENICEKEITAISCLHEKIFIGSRDQTIQLYNY